jgi:hypothetical protein
MPTQRDGFGRPERRWPVQDWIDRHPYMTAAIGFSVSMAIGLLLLSRGFYLGIVGG